MSCFWPVESELPRSLDRLVELVGQALDEVQHVDVAGGLAQVAVGDGFVAEADVLGQRAGEEERVLQDDGEVLAERGQVVLAQVDAVQQDLAGGHLVEAHHQAGEGGLAGAGVADDGDCLARLDGEGDVLENPLDSVEAREISRRG